MFLQSIQSVIFKKSSGLRWCVEVIGIYFQNHTKLFNILRGKVQSLSYCSRWYMWRHFSWDGCNAARHCTLF